MGRLSRRAPLHGVHSGLPGDQRRELSARHLVPLHAGGREGPTHTAARYSALGPEAGDQDGRTRLRQAGRQGDGEGEAGVRDPAEAALRATATAAGQPEAAADLRARGRLRRATTTDATRLRPTAAAGSASSTGSWAAATSTGLRATAACPPTGLRAALSLIGFAGGKLFFSG